jgi:hypothetical protein
MQFVDKINGPERLVCDGKLHFGKEYERLDGMKLVGFSLWRSTDGETYVTLPSRAFGAGTERKYFDYLRSHEGDSAKSSEYRTRFSGNTARSTAVS